MKNELKNKDNFVIYTTDDNNIDVEVYLEDENLWMTQEQISIFCILYQIVYFKIIRKKLKTNK